MGSCKTASATEKQQSEAAAEASTGVVFCFQAEDGIRDFILTNFNDQYHSLFIGSKTFPYLDRTVASHLAAMSKPFVGWGVKFLDYDNDGKLDVVLVNGHINEVIESTRGDVKYREPPLLLHNDGRGILENVRERAGPTFNANFVARALATGDFDNDGDPDIVFTTLDGPPLLLRTTQVNRMPGLTSSCREGRAIGMRSDRRSR